MQERKQKQLETRPLQASLNDIAHSKKRRSVGRGTDIKETKTSTVEHLPFALGFCPFLSRSTTGNAQQQ